MAKKPKPIKTEKEELLNQADAAAAASAALVKAAAAHLRGG